jgi:hypothetical protein
MITVLTTLLAATVTFVECPKCDKRLRISDDGRTAFVNLSRIRPSEKKAMTARAERFLALAKPVDFANPKTPLMGWSSWNTFGLDISEEVIVGVARAMATNGLKAAGYAYVNIDDGFFDGHGKDGRLKFHPTRFPRGLKGTVDGIHAVGMKAGTYSDAGANTCGSYGGDKGGRGAGLYGHDAADCQLHFKELGFDFIKVDYCGARALRLDERTRYTQIAEAIRATGRTDVRFNICRWAFPGTWAADIAGSWRTTGDIRARWSSVRQIVAQNLYLSAYAGPGHFNDMDMLEAGMLAGKVKSFFGKRDPGLTRDEETTHFGMWCILASPLVLGNDVRTMPADSLRLVTNPFLLRMNQDPLCLQAYVASKQGDGYVFVKDALTRFGTSRYVALYNSGDKERTFTVRARDLDLGGTIAAFDLVERADIGEFQNEVCVTVRPHASKFYLFDAEKRLDRVVYEAETAFLTEFNCIGKNKNNAAYVRAERKASGGAAVYFLGNTPTNDLIWKDVYVSRPGTYTLSIAYTAPSDRTFLLQVDGGAPVTLTTPTSPKGRFETVSHRVTLEKGVHRVRLSNPTDYTPDIDRLTITRSDML